MKKGREKSSNIEQNRKNTSTLVETLTDTNKTIYRIQHQKQIKRDKSPILNCLQRVEMRRVYSAVVQWCLIIRGKMQVWCTGFDSSGLFYFLSQINHWHRNQLHKELLHKHTQASAHFIHISLHPHYHYHHHPSSSQSVIFSPINRWPYFPGSELCLWCAMKHFTTFLSMTFRTKTWKAECLI